MSNYVRGWGSNSAKIMVIGEAPGHEEDITGFPLVGATGRMHDKLMEAAGIRREDTYITNVFKYRPPDNQIDRASETGHTIAEGIPQLESEIRTINPNVILALGNLALTTLTGKEGITKWRGSILLSHFGVKVVPSIHPAGLVKAKGSEGAYDYRTRQFIQHDYCRAVEESKSPTVDLPQRTVQIGRTSGIVYEFLRQYQNAPLCSVDIESLSCIPICIALAFNSYHAMSIPLLNFENRDKFQIPHDDLAETWLLLDHFFQRKGTFAHCPPLKLIGQNFKYDAQKLAKPCGFRLPPLHADTMLMAGVAYPEFPKSLGFLASIWTREPFYKDEGREFNIKRDPVEQLFHYNGKDALVTFEIQEALDKELIDLGLHDFYYSFQHPLHDLYLFIEEQGFHTNYERRLEVIEKYRKMWADEQAVIDGILGQEVNVASPKQVKPFLKALGLPDRKDTSEDTIVALLGNHAKTEKQIVGLNKVLEIRRIRKALSACQALPDFDGIMRTSYRIAGTETGRTSTTNLAPPLRPHVNVTGEKKSRTIGIAFQTITKHGDFGTEIREFLEPPPGHVLLQWDMSQAEARVVALLSEDFELLALFNSGTDVHRWTANLILFDKQRKLDDISEDERFLGKTGRHSGNYGVGKRRYMLEVNNLAHKFHIPVRISEWKAGKILEAFHKFTPKVQGVFHERIKKVAHGNRVLINPFGRRREFFDRLDDELYKEMYAQVPQSTVSDKNKSALVEIHTRLPHLSIIMEAHDAGLAAVREKDIAEVREIVKEIMERPIDFSRCNIGQGELVIPCDFEIGENYKSLRKEKKWYASVNDRSA